MGITRPTTPTILSVADVQSLAIADGDTWETLGQTQHYAFAHTGARIPGPYLSTAATTTSTSYTQSNATADQPDLDIWFPVSQILRLADNAGSDSAHFGLSFYGHNVGVRVSCIALDTGTSAFTLTAETTSGSWEWVDAFGAVTWATTFEGGSTANPKRNFAFKMEFKVPVSGTASLLCWHLHEEYIAASDIP